MLLLVWMPFHISKWTWELQTLGFKSPGRLLRSPVHLSYDFLIT